MECYICNSSNFKRRNGSVRDDAKLIILECNNCGLVSLDSVAHIHSNFYHNLNNTETDIINHVLKTIKKNPSKFDLDNDFRNTILEFLSNKIGNKSKKQFEKEWNKSIA